MLLYTTGSRNSIRKSICGSSFRNVLSGKT